MLNLVESPENLLYHFLPCLFALAKAKHKAVESQNGEKQSHAANEGIDCPIKNRVAVPFISTEGFLVEFRSYTAIRTFQRFYTILIYFVSLLQEILTNFVLSPVLILL